MAANQRQPSTDKGCRQAHNQRQDPKDLNACGDGVHRFAKPIPSPPSAAQPPLGAAVAAFQDEFGAGWVSVAGKQAS